MADITRVNAQAGQNICIRNQESYAYFELGASLSVRSSHLLFCEFCGAGHKQK